MKTEIIIRTQEEIITPKMFAVLVAEQGVPVGKTFWCNFGSTDCCKCILLSHGYTLKRGMVSIENKFQQFTVIKE